MFTHKNNKIRGMEGMLSKKILALSLLTLFFSASNAFTADNDSVGLQNLHTRTIIYCYSNSDYTAEECASFYETQGFTRMRNIPQKPAKYDFLTVETYPTRRWRDGEKTPRW